MKHRILFVGTSVSGGGAERVFINIINSLDLSKYEVRVFYTCASEKCNIASLIPIVFAGKPHMRQALRRLCLLMKEFQPHSVFTSHGTIAYTLPIVRFITRINFKIYTRVAVTPSEIYETSIKGKLLHCIYPRLYKKSEISKNSMAKIVLMYHDLYIQSGAESGFQNESAFQYKIQVDEFEKQVKAVVDYCREHIEIQVDFTFDDGGVSFLTLAAPILEKYGLKGIFFISTEYINTPLFLSSAQLQELSDRGHHIGSHAHSHKPLTTLSENEITKEWVNSINLIKPYTTTNISASIPNGDENSIVRKKALEAGINKLYTSVPTTRTKRFYGMPVFGRYVIYQGMTSTDVIAIISNKHHRNKILLKWRLLSLTKNILGNKYNKIKVLLFRRN